MRWSPLLVVLAVACSDRGDAPTAVARGASPVPEAQWPTPTVVAPDRVTVTATRTTTLHVEVPNRSAIGSVISVEPTRVPAGLTVDPGVIGMRDTGTDVVIHTSDINPGFAYGRLELSLVTTLGVEATADIVVDVSGVPGRLFRNQDLILDDVRALDVDANNRVVVAGHWNDRAVVIRLHVRAGLDSTFGSFGSMRPANDLSSGETSVAEAVAAHADTALVVGGSRGAPSFVRRNLPAFVVRVLADGTVDPSFVFTPSEDRRLGGVAVDALDRAVVVLADDQAANVEVSALSLTGAVLAAATLSAPSASATLVTVASDAQRRVHLAFSDGTIMRLASDLSVEATTKERPFSAMAFRRSLGPVFIRAGGLDVGEGFIPDKTEVTAWSAIAVDNHGKIVGGGVAARLDTAYVATFWP